MFTWEGGDLSMKQVTFAQFRQNAVTYFNAVEKGEIVQILRHGKAIAEITPITVNHGMTSWKQKRKPKKGKL
jgi:antitoxin (DNA-binding transcriptional repressor) of toxin-antitoxin stability system